jgi:putative transposase
MPHTYSSNRIHIVFSTKEREKRISSELQPKLWAYMAGIARKIGMQSAVVGGIDNHVHVLALLPATLTLARAAQLLKGNSSKWINDHGYAGEKFAWQEGYGAFSVSASQTPNVVRYIQNQVEHHAQHSFEQEFISLLTRYGIAYDSDHVLG